MTKDKYLKERKGFEKKVYDLACADYTTEEPVDFGYKHLDATEDEIITCTDWGNVWSFIVTLLDKKEKEAKREVIKEALVELRGYLRAVRQKYPPTPDIHWDDGVKSAIHTLERLNPNK